ncbi:LuxR C-terminal-related transcriptional regulator [Streptacidiphilus sp. EB129]|jgi:DNA-binding CsgD family transcriptional regulator|uniref:LuxR C-terminal-related transcriptional regulator n=1 Tax=Streptacidiphilus sp. EB129 TaxID=3156262 RepID=UPI003518A698
MLEAFGVDPVAEAVYLAMLRRPDADAEELTAHLELDGDTVRSALDELARLALLRPSWEDPLALRPVTPELGLEALLARQQAELLTRQHQIEQGRAALAVVVAETAGGRHTGAADVEELVGIDAIRERLERLTASTRFEVLTFVPSGAQTEGARDSSRPLDMKLLERGVDMRTVYLESVRNDPATIAYARWLTERGGQVRTTATLPLRMIVVDRETAVVPLNPQSPRAGAAVLHGSGAVAAMCALFEQIWDTATPLGIAKQRDEQGLSDQEKALLRMLAQGDTDEATARKLGISDRTVRRLIADLMSKLGARSRFQAGFLATEHGWLSSSAHR